MLGALLAWEHGEGMGHVTTLKAVAEALSDRFTFDTALCDLTHGNVLAGLCTPVQGPWLPMSEDYRISQGNPRRATWGEFLGDVGFRQPEILRESITWWQGVMRECEISLVIGDCAPCALMAARGLEIPSIAISTGYLTPPPNMDRFPVLLPQYSTCIYDEAETVQIVNSAVAEFGLPPLKGLPEIYASSDQIVFSLDILDPYSAFRDRPPLPPMLGGDTEPAAEGDEIFVYFSNDDMKNPELVEAICTLGPAVRLFVPQIDLALAAELIWRGVHVEADPVAPALIARRSRILVNAAQYGMTCLGFAAGLPQVAVPRDLEKQYNASVAASRGVMCPIDRQDITVEGFRSIVLDAYEDAAMTRRARDLAEDLRPQFEVNQRKMIRRRVAAVMDYRV
ncbi:hypothetical protein ABMA32_16410 [Mesorhizobium sp. VNQ89]|uniref:glycosyltransferase n=1 Tax=Mesorhizobium quangtriensis TaxID=3157709 RepID=UPI0032B83F2A